MRAFSKKWFNLFQTFPAFSIALLIHRGAQCETFNKMWKKESEQCETGNSITQDKFLSVNARNRMRKSVVVMR